MMRFSQRKAPLQEKILLEEIYLVSSVFSFFGGDTASDIFSYSLELSIEV
jgi:hypothetical protein